jgi:hypothetical protein
VFLSLIIARGQDQLLQDQRFDDESLKSETGTSRIIVYGSRIGTRNERQLRTETMYS